MKIPKLVYTQPKTFYSKNGDRIIRRLVRMEHQCSQCGDTIEMGDEEREITGQSNFYGGFYTIYICSDCWRD